MRVSISKASFLTTESDDSRHWGLEAEWVLPGRWKRVHKTGAKE